MTPDVTRETFLNNNVQLKKKLLYIVFFSTPALLAGRQEGHPAC